MKIDGHAHACGTYLTAEGIIKTLDENGVDKVVLVPGEWNSTSDYSLPNIAAKFPNHNVVKLTNFVSKLVIGLTGKVKDIPRGNEYVYKLRKKAEGRIIQFVWATTGIDNIPEYLTTKYADWNFHGVKVHQCWEKFSIDSAFFEEVALWTEQHELPLFIHLYSDKDVIRIIEYKRKHPKLKLIVAHLFGLELFVKHFTNDGNLYFDTSPFQLISEVRLQKAIEYVGANHVLMGTDTPYGATDNLSKSINRIKNLNLSEEDKAAILGGNMERIITL